MKYLKDYLTSFTVFLEILKKKKKKKKALKKKKKKKSSENVQSTGHFQSFLFIFFRPLDPRSGKKFPVNQLIKKIWPKQYLSSCLPFTKLCGESKT